MYICHVFKEDDIRVNYLPCTYYIKLILAGSVDKCTVYVFFATWTQNVKCLQIWSQTLFRITCVNYFICLHAQILLDVSTV